MLLKTLTRTALRRARAAPLSTGAAVRAKSKGVAWQWDDPLSLSANLDADEQLIYDTAKAYAQESLLPRVIEGQRNEVRPSPDRPSPHATTARFLTRPSLDVRPHHHD